MIFVITDQNVGDNISKKDVKTKNVKSRTAILDILMFVNSLEILDIANLKNGSILGTVKT